MVWRVYVKETALTVLWVKAVCKLFIVWFLSLTRLVIRNPHGVNFIHASCDLLLLALSIIFAFLKAKIIPTQ